MSVYAGAGIVEGSTSQGEWTETSHKHGVITSLFSSAPLTINQAPTANAAFSTVFVEELIRSGITMFYVCPGSRSTPLTAAVAKAVKYAKNVGIVRAVSVHDERGAAYRAIGFARRTGRPAAVITSSGTAVGNLFPAVMEADEDGVPILLLTADRPYEARGMGANQAVDQVKVRYFCLLVCSFMFQVKRSLTVDSTFFVTFKRHLELMSDGSEIFLPLLMMQLYRLPRPFLMPIMLY